MIVLDKVIANHVLLCDSVLDDSFIEKDKYEYILDKIPSITLRKLSEDEFKNGITKLLDYDIGKIKQETYGKVFYVETDNVKVPVLYNLLCEFYLNIDADTRSNSFHDVTEKYYNRVLSNRGLTKDQFRTQVRMLLPYAKLERLYQLCKEDNIDEIREASWEVEECILYPELLREEVYSIVRNMYKSNEADLIGYDVVLSKDLPGNLGKYFKINITVRNSTRTQTHHLFAKMIDKDKEALSEFAAFPFRKERFFFEIMLERLKELGTEKLADLCPKCYFARNDLLLFEDISVDGFSSWNYHVPVTHNWLATTVKILAKLHAASIIFEEKLGSKLGKTVRLDEEYPDDVREAAFVDREDYRPYRDCTRRSIYDYLLSKFPEVPKIIHIDILRHKVKAACERMYEIIKKSDKIRNVLNHGDMWGANIMYKEDKTTQASSAYLIDFQLTRYCPPSVDLMFLLYTNTDRATRLKHLKDLIELYYSELARILSLYDIEVKNIFSFDQLMESCKDVEPVIICTSLMYGELLLIPEQHRKDIENDKEREKQFYMEDKGPELEKIWEYEPFKIRMEGLVEDIVRIFEDTM